MAREWRRLLVPPARIAGAAVTLEPSEAHYLRRVLRLRPGERFALVDGAGHLWSATLAPETPGEPASALLEQPPGQPLQSEPPPKPRLALAVALPRQDADVLLRMASELGIDRLTPLRAGRSAAAEPLKPQRQAAILREASEQCERLWLPLLDPVQPAEGWLASPPALPPGLPPAAAAAADGQPKVLATALGLLATTRREGLPSLEQALAGVQAAPAAVVVAIGPEGGWTPAEERQAEAAGWRPVSLGATILRSSTAAVSAAVLMAAWRRGLSCGTSRPPSP
ncbi:16S rRNA (uracil(1498)-N(3))-methyltransferase [Cyanobium sp. CH-040]|uniref:16S rRNA (uracil(1498)-N(3))-methyltransferase n=1 Tax=Cyanobium sp. CH-040 TaxID=2823708 RepID=UPI0020CDCBE3|nr:16S rRNA (uracil(1498)-N(3))-methyltransferase [Cyanobium sp. CH-040]MCP9927608.1 16S rRNA (uracil(1498)-N(3))-methyltransferase [Cyanobium sp. CH-040]